ncbi:hypothetical protein Barb7_00361 [Bacteroidales bacterium Barb7]|nr:hypothetical protein Barb7_00361 [Bacteroidales bacterium Barb7]
MLKAAALPSVHVDTEAGRFRTFQLHGFNVKRLAVPVIHHKMLGGRTNRAEYGIKRKRINRKTQAVIRIDRVIAVQILTRGEQKTEAKGGKEEER